MTRFFLILSLFGCYRTFSQSSSNVLDWKADMTLNTYLIQQVHRQYDERRVNFAKAVASKEGTLNYINQVRNKFLQLLGDFPEISPLNAAVTGVLKRQGYTIEKIVYESFAGHHVTSNLYIPSGKGPFPAMLLFCGHEDVSKATVSYQQTAILFAKNGFVVFVIDPLSQSERHQLTDEQGNPLTRGGTTEHTLINEASNLFGNSVPAYELWDNKRGLDYLVTRPEVDSSRIGCLGNSGGAMQTIYFAAFDKRVKVMAPCSYLASRERNLEMTGPADGCAQMPGEGKMQLELNDFLIAAAPKPLLILAGRYDFIDYTGTLIAYDELKKVYASLGSPQKLSLFTYDDGHGISQPKREAAVNWFRKWLYNNPSPVTESADPALPAKELMCTPAGQVNSTYAGEVTIMKRNLKLFDDYIPARNIFLRGSREQALKKIKEILSIHSIDTSMQTEIISEEKINNGRALKIILRKKDDIPLPIRLYLPEKDAKKTIIWLDGEGMRKMADSASLLQSYLDQQYCVLFCDIRGTGETTDRAEFNDPKYYNKEYRNAMTALHTGQSLVGQRVKDILALTGMVMTGPVEINAGGITALPALHAAVLDQRITQLNLYNTIESFRDILENPAARDWYSYIIPSVLKYYDIPDLIKLAGTQRIKFIK